MKQFYVTDVQCKAGGHVGLKRLGHRVVGFLYFLQRIKAGGLSVFCAVYLSRWAFYLLKGGTLVSCCSGRAACWLHIDCFRASVSAVSTVHALILSNNSVQLALIWPAQVWSATPSRALES